MKDLWRWDRAEIHTVPLTLEALSSGSAPELLDCFRDFFFKFFCFLGFCTNRLVVCGVFSGP